MNLVKFATILSVMTSLSIMTSSADKNVAEVRVYVDDSALEYWKKATGKTENAEFLKEMRSNFFEINELFKTLKTNGVDLQVQIERVIMMDQNILNTINGKINKTDALQEFDDWLKYSDSKYDVAILFTGSDLMDSFGQSHWSTVCSSKALAVVQLRATFDNVVETAHELGHIFGATNDGDKMASSCSAGSGEIMGLSVPFYSRKFSFSSCSAKAIKSKIEELSRGGVNCMSTWNKSREITGPRFGSLVTADEVCKRSEGPNSYAFRRITNFCTFLACKSDRAIARHGSVSQTAPQGLNCGPNRQCIQGKCVDSPNGSADVLSWCPLGNQPEIYREPWNTCFNVTKTQCIRLSEECCIECHLHDINVPRPGTENDHMFEKTCVVIEDRDPTSNLVRIVSTHSIRKMNGFASTSKAHRITRSSLGKNFNVKTIQIHLTDDQDIYGMRIVSNETCKIVEEVDPDSDLARVAVTTLLKFWNGKTWKDYHAKLDKKTDIHEYARFQHERTDKNSGQ